jgi:flavodoxin
MESLLILYSYHHKNTEKIAKVMAEILDANIRTPQQLVAENLQDYSLIGFGSGIYSAKHHESILYLANRLPHVNNQKAFIFSTSSNLEPSSKNHSTLRKILKSKGYLIIDEFTCAGFNTNSFSRFFGGINKRRPNAEDLENAAIFAKNLKQKM